MVAIISPKYAFRLPTLFQLELWGTARGFVFTKANARLVLQRPQHAPGWEGSAPLELWEDRDSYTQEALDEATELFAQIGILVNLEPWTILTDLQRMPVS